MRILLIMDPGISVPPTQYGGHERLVYMFAEEYQNLGHQVTLLAGPSSYCSGKTITFGTNDLNRSRIKKYKEIFFVWKYLIQNKAGFDLVHNFGRLLYLIPILNSPIKKIMTYGRTVAPSGIKFTNRFSVKNLIFTACSNSCVKTGNVAGVWKTVYNAIDFGAYQLNNNIDQAGAPLMFLGRLDRIKGVHTAINVAKATNCKLLIGGNISHTSDNYNYFKKEIELLIDNEQIKYLGPLNDADKNYFLRQAKALLFPIEWEEPFGMVMIEAMACGTPVIGFKRGSVPEVIDEGTTGFVVENESEMIEKISMLNLIDREVCRKTAEERFNLNKISKQYLSLFS